MEDPNLLERTYWSFYFSCLLAVLWLTLIGGSVNPGVAEFIVGTWEIEGRGDLGGFGVPGEDI